MDWHFPIITYRGTRWRLDPPTTTFFLGAAPRPAVRR